MKEIQKISQSLKLKKQSAQIPRHRPCPSITIRAHTSFNDNRKLYGGKEVMIKTSFSQVPTSLPEITTIHPKQVTRHVKNVLRRSTKSRLGNIYRGKYLKDVKRNSK